MSAEKPTIIGNRIYSRINDFLVGGPIKIPDSISTLEATYHPLPTIVFDSNERRQIEDALAAVDATTVIAREGVRHGDALAEKFFGGMPRELPDAQQRSSNRVQARRAAHKVLESLGVNGVLTISQPTENSPTQLVARRLHRLIGDIPDTSRVEDIVREERPDRVLLHVEEHVSSRTPANPGTYTTERSLTRKVRFAKSRPLLS